MSGGPNFTSALSEWHLPLLNKLRKEPPKQNHKTGNRQPIQDAGRKIANWIQIKRSLNSSIFCVSLITSGIRLFSSAVVGSIFSRLKKKTNYNEHPYMYSNYPHKI